MSSEGAPFESRVVPGRSYARQTEIYDWEFPAFDDPFTIPDDSASFVYDWRGNLEQADNDYAKIRRTYFSGGALNADSISIRNYGNGSFGNYDFKLSLEYDRNGRRTAVHHPANLNPGATQYSYGSLTGFLSQVTDAASEVYGFTYDANGQAITRTFPAGSDSVAYDDDGRLSQLYMSTPSEGFSEGIAYDGSGRISAVVTLDGREFYYRNGLGHLVEAEISGSRPGQRDRYERDGFGNATIFHTWAPGEYDDIDRFPGSRQINVFPDQRGGRIGYSQDDFKQRYMSYPPPGWMSGFEQH